VPRLQPIATNFTAGELSPRTRGRVDIAQYNNGAQRLLNCYPVIQGGAVSRPGTIFTGEAKHHDKKSRLIPFVVRKGAAYVTEWGEGYIRFYKDAVYLLSVNPGFGQIGSPFNETQVFDIDWGQDSDTMYIAYSTVIPYRLRRFSDTVWDMAITPFSTIPFDEIGRRPAATLTLSATSVGTGRTVTASAAVFLASDVGRAISYQGGIAVVTVYNSTTNVTADITIAFASTAVPSGWLLDSSPQTINTPSAANPVGATITLTLTADGWRAADVGSYVRINGGLVRITVVTSALVVSAIILKELTGVVAAPALAWTIETSTWNGTDGFPRTVSLHQQRLVFAGSTGYPQTIWGSRIGEPLDFTRGTADSDGYAFTLASDENNQIAWLSAARDLMALTFGAEYSLRGGVEKPITPTNVQIKPESNHGASAARPVQIKREAMFVQRAGRKVRALAYKYDFDGYNAPDVIALSEHLTGKAADGTQLSIVDMAYQQEPDTLLWCVRSDGKLLSCTIDRDQSVVGWAQHDVGDAVESVCVVPADGADVLYLLVRRTINGATKRFIERMEMSTTSTRTSEKNLMQVDCGAFLYVENGQAFVNAPLLVGKQIDVVGDGAYLGRFTVPAGGVVTLPRAANSLMWGLPFTTQVLPVTPEIGTGTGTAAGQAMRTSKATLRVLDSGPVTINGQLLPFRNFGSELLDKPQPLFTGDADASEAGWEDGSSDLLIERSLPFPMHLLAVIRDFTVNSG